MDEQNNAQSLMADICKLCDKKQNMRFLKIDA